MLRFPSSCTLLLNAGIGSLLFGEMLNPLARELLAIEPASGIVSRDLDQN